MTESHFQAPARDAQILAIIGPRPLRTAPRSEPHDGWLRVHFGSGTPAHADFDFRWLYDDGARTPRSAEPPAHLDVLASYVDAERRLHVQWEESYAARVELSETVHSLDWLREHADAPSDLAFIEVDARRVGPHWALREFCFDRLYREGAVVVRDFGSNTEGLAQLFEQAGLTVVAHADPARPPRYQLLHCIEPAAVEQLRSVDSDAWYRFALGAGDFVLVDDRRMRHVRGAGHEPHRVRSVYFEMEKEW